MNERPTAGMPATNADGLPDMDALPNAHLVAEVLHLARRRDGDPLTMQQKAIALIALGRVHRRARASPNDLLVQDVWNLVYAYGEDWLEPVQRRYNQFIKGAFETLNAYLTPGLDPDVAYPTLLCALLIVRPVDVDRLIAEAHPAHLRPVA